MRANRLGWAFGLALATAGAGWAAEKAAPAVPLAMIGTTPITEADVQAHLAGLPFQARQQYYQMQKQLLDDLIGKKLLDAEAAARKVTTEELLKQEVDAKVAEPTDAEAKDYYDKNKAQFGATPEAEGIKQYKDWQKGQRASEKRRDYLASLRTKGGVKVMLEPPRMQVDAADGPAKGPETAPVTIVEFSDFQCPYCSRVVPTIKKITETYGDKVRIVFRDLPLLQLHPNAAKAAEAAQCANEQGKFWDMHDKLFANQGALGVPELKKYATELGLKSDVFDQCLDSGKAEANWKKDAEDAQKYGLTGTPGFFVNGRMIGGAQPYETFAQMIDEELDLAAAKATAKAAPKAPAPPVKK